MPKLSVNFNWKESPTHIELLKAFSKPHDVNHILTWQTIRQTLGETTEDAIERFIRNSVLVTATLEESIAAVFQVAELKKLLGEQYLALSGSKGELAERLVQANRGDAEKLLQKHKVMKCSEAALAMLDERKSKQAQELELAQKNSFEFLKNGNPKDAYRSYADYHKKYSNFPYKNGSYAVKELQFILTSNSKVLGNIGHENLRLLQTAAGMGSLWGDEKPELWLPEGFTIPLINNKRALSYILRNASFRENLTNEYTKKVKISFESSDVDSCSLCLALDGKIFDTDKVPELPIPGCTSEIGCMCRLQPYFESITNDDENDDIDFSASDDELEGIEGLGTNPVRKLRFLKQMLDEALITQDEYDVKKKEILAKL